MRPAAVQAMLPFFTTRFANPSGSHRFARDARKAIDEARDQVAEAIGVRPGEIVFTGCGTEADNMAIHGAGSAVVCSATEHHAVLHPVEQQGGTVVGVDATGHIDLDQLAQALTAETALVSVMAVNNEVGTVTDLAAVAAIVRERAPQALLHTDAIQAAHWLDLRPVAPLVDLMSLSAHKFGGPKGVGLLTIRAGAEVAPLLRGGGQERERRSGTHNVAGIVAMATALTETDADRAGDNARIAALRDRLIDGLIASVDGVVETVPRDRKVAGAAHVCLAGVESESMLYLLDEADVCASAASACASGAMEPSHVLTAMGVDPALAAGALRMSLGHSTTESDVDRAIEVVVESVVRLRRLAVR
jgi:cysteine desulfurase